MSPGEVPTWAEAMSAYANGASTVSNIITAVVTGIAAYVAYRAADAWRHMLRNQRIDECLIAIRDFEGALRKVVSLLNEEVNPQTIWAAHQELWTGWRDLNKAFTALSRYSEKRWESEAMILINDLTLHIDFIEAALSRHTMKQAHTHDIMQLKDAEASLKGTLSKLQQKLPA